MGYLVKTDEREETIVQHHQAPGERCIACICILKLGIILKIHPIVKKLNRNVLSLLKLRLVMKKDTDITCIVTGHWKTTSAVD